MHLTQMCYPGWTKLVRDKKEAVRELKPEICYRCIDELVRDGRDPNNLDDLLWTRCGSEYMMED